MSTYYASKSVSTYAGCTGAQGAGASLRGKRRSERVSGIRAEERRLKKKKRPRGVQRYPHMPKCVRPENALAIQPALERGRCTGDALALCTRQTSVLRLKGACARR